jgi:hypothetical protein
MYRASVVLPLDAIGRHVVDVPADLLEKKVKPGSPGARWEAPYTPVTHATPALLRKFLGFV